MSVKFNQMPYRTSLPCFIVTIILLIIGSYRTTSFGQKVGRIQEKNLNSSINKLIQKLGLEYAHCGVLVVNVKTRHVMMDHNSREYFVPASTLKLLTTFAALIELGPDFRFQTNLWTKLDKGMPTSAYELVLGGTGDPFLVDNEWMSKSPSAWSKLADSLLSRGIRKVERVLVVDESPFGEDLIPPFWSAEDVDEFYGAPISSLNAGHNVHLIKISPGERVGSIAKIAFYPTLDNYYLYENHVKTVAGKNTSIRVRRSRDSGKILIIGSIGLQVPHVLKTCTVSHPPMYAGHWFLKTLKARGVQVKTAIVGTFSPLSESVLSPVGILRSESLSAIIRRINKESDNLGAECVLRSIGEKGSHKYATTRGTLKLKEILFKAGIPQTPPPITVDGSGLSRTNLLTPGHLMWVLLEALERPFVYHFVNSLAVAGVDEKLRLHPLSKRFPRKILAKTGSFTNTHCLAGYYLGIDGKPAYAFVVMINGLADDEKSALELEYQIISELKAVSTTR